VPRASRRQGVSTVRGVAGQPADEAPGARRARSRRRVPGPAGPHPAQSARVHRARLLVPESVRGMRIRLRVLLRPVRARVRHAAGGGQGCAARGDPGAPRRGAAPVAGLRAGHLREARPRGRARAGPEAAGRPQGRDPDHRHRHRHRSLPARGAPVPSHPAGAPDRARAAGPSASPHLARHQEPARHERHRAAPSRRRPARAGRAPLAHHDRSARDPPAGAAVPAAARAAPRGAPPVRRRRAGGDLLRARPARGHRRRADAPDAAHRGAPRGRPVRARLRAAGVRRRPRAAAARARALAARGRPPLRHPIPAGAKRPPRTGTPCPAACGCSARRSGSARHRSTIRSRRRGRRSWCCGGERRDGGKAERRNGGTAEPGDATDAGGRAPGGAAGSVGARGLGGRGG